ncbi:hypothetical protein SASPL_142847 [Salvia splendens]|uniref:Amino acid transporter transmembrane domain-containing protein n=1 Tax=Salvia splendens TaxID=180675 RepID=A0A8X8Z9U9_SALSN|nr:hypothetical protein SASPL_142847 [Salvia splendens]
MTIKTQKKPRTQSKKSKTESVSVTIADEKTPLLISNKAESSSFSHQEANGASFTGAVFNLSTTIIGAGIMALPATMKVLGLALGIAAIAFVAVLTEISISMLLRFSKAGAVASYGGVMGNAFGAAGRKSLQVCVVICNIGVLIVYMIIIGDVISGSSPSGIHHPGLMESWFGQQWWTGRLFVLVVTTLGVFTPLAFLKRIDSLRHTSAVAVFLAVLFLVITAGIVVVKWMQGGVEWPRLLPDISSFNSNSIWSLFTVVPVLVTAYVCHFNASSASSCSVMPRWMTCSNFDTDLGIPFSSQLNDGVRLSYALHLMLVFPVIFYPLRLNLDGLIFSSIPLTADNLRFTSLTIALMSVIFLGANFIPSIWDAFQFTGATTAVCIGFIFPAAVVLRDVHGITTWKQKTLAVFMVALAVFASLVAIYSDAYAIFKRNSTPSNE